MICRLRILALSLALLASTVLVAGAAKASSPAGTPGLSRHTFTNAAGSRDYLLYVPDRVGPLPLVVFLHGCGADPEAYGLDRFAQLRGFAVAYPIQSTSADAGGCWHWTGAQNTHRDSPEPSIIAGITQQVQSLTPIDTRRTFIAGHSAGSGLAAILAAAYPDLYAAAGLISGCGSLSCADITGRTAYREMGPRARPVPAYIAWGSADQVDPYVLGRIQLLQWAVMNDLADDGLANLSVPRLPNSIALTPAAGTVPAAITEHYRDRAGCAQIDFATGIGMGHIPDFTWPFVFPAMIDFLLGHPARAC